MGRKSYTGSIRRAGVALLAGLCLLAGAGPRAQAAGAPQQAACTFGVLDAPVRTAPALFDDFTYGSTALTYRGGRSPVLFTGSLFGPNPWHGCHDVRTARAWHRYNRDDLPFNDAGAIRVQGGVVSLALRPGYRHDPGDHTQRRPPQMESTFAFAEGSFVARIRFSEMEPGQDINQAFFTMSRSLRSELDFEWTNNPAFPAAGAGKMFNTNHRGGAQAGPVAMRCWQQGRPLSACAAPVAGRWLLLRIGYDGRRAVYEMVEDVRRDPIRWEVVLDTHLPYEPMHVLFSNAVHTDRPRRLRQGHAMEVDWFYYTPAQVSLDAVRAEVERFRRYGLARVNTTGTAL